MSLSHKNTPRDVFLHLLSIVTLYIGVIAFITLWFQYIDILFPDQLTYFPLYRFSAVHGAMASLIVAWPIFTFISRVIGNEFRKESGKRNLGVRKWLLYLTLFIAAIVIIVDLITLITNFLGGELTAKFLFKIIIVLAVAGVVFGYYFWDLKRSDTSTSNAPWFLAWTLSLVIIGSILAGFFIAGTPQEQRARKFDDQRVTHLRMIQSELFRYYQDTSSLPESLEALENDVTGFSPPLDPETGTLYEYANTDDLTFSLCANFTTSNSLSPVTDRPVKQPAFSLEDNWQHEAEYTCFERTIDPERLTNTFPVREPVPIPVRPVD